MHVFKLGHFSYYLQIQEIIQKLTFFETRSG